MDPSDRKRGKLEDQKEDGKKILPQTCGNELDSGKQKTERLGNKRVLLDIYISISKIIIIFF